MKEGEEAGIFRPVNPALFQMIYDASIERFLSGDELKNYQIPYMDALNGLVDMMICGIKINGE